MALTTEQVALWKRNAEIVNSFATDMSVKILHRRIIALADEILAIREAPPAPTVPDELTPEDCPAFVKYDNFDVDAAWAQGWNACRAEMLRGAK